MARGITGFEIEGHFDTEDEAIEWGRNNFKSKYDYAFVEVGKKTYLLCDCGMCDDSLLRGKLETAVIGFFEDLGLSIKDDSIYIDLGADMNEIAWDYLSKYCDFDVLYAFDTF